VSGPGIAGVCDYEFAPNDAFARAEPARRAQERSWFFHDREYVAAVRVGHVDVSVEGASPEGEFTSKEVDFERDRRGPRPPDRGCG